jgi:hypothetical protein
VEKSGKIREKVEKSGRNVQKKEKTGKPALWPL